MDVLVNGGEEVEKKLNETIISLCKTINEVIEKEQYMELDQLASITKALAELVTAKANVFTD